MSAPENCLPNSENQLACLLRNTVPTLELMHRKTGWRSLNYFLFQLSPKTSNKWDISIDCTLPVVRCCTLLQSCFCLFIDVIYESYRTLGSRLYSLRVSGHHLPSNIKMFGAILKIANRKEVRGNINKLQMMSKIRWQ